MVGDNLFKWLTCCIAKNFTKCVSIFTYVIAFKKCFFECALKVSFKCSSITNPKISYFTYNKNLLTFGLSNIIFFLSFTQINVYAQTNNTFPEVLKVTVKSDSGGQVNTRNDNDQDITQYNNKN